MNKPYILRVEVVELTDNGNDAPIEDRIYRQWQEVDSISLWDKGVTMLDQAYLAVQDEGTK